jgi:hypothetical protein
MRAVLAQGSESLALDPSLEFLASSTLEVELRRFRRERPAYL